MRLDVYLVACKKIESRQKAQELISNGKIKVNGILALKPSLKISDDMKVDIAQHHSYVSRAALKLKGFLQQSSIEVKGKKALDIGSCTGGFVQILLEYGASSVVCVDVGKGQLHDMLRNHSLVIYYEQTDIRHFYSSPFELVTCDVSFISLRHIMPDICRLCACEAILLFKPQFEVGRVKRSKKGVVLDKGCIMKALDDILELIAQQGFYICGLKHSTIKGKSGNAETFIHISR